LIGLPILFQEVLFFIMNNKGIDAETVKKSDGSQPEEFGSYNGSQTDQYVPYIDGISYQRVRPCDGQTLPDL